MNLIDYQDRVEANHGKCVCCGTGLIGLALDCYDHEDGWVVDGFRNRQWLSVHCPKCQYDNSLNKLGVYRDGYDFDRETVRSMVAKSRKAMEEKDMEGKSSYVVLENRGAMGIVMIRHPYATFELAQKRAAAEATCKTGRTFYVAEIQAKYVSENVVKGTVLV